MRGIQAALFSWPEGETFHIMLPVIPLPLISLLKVPPLPNAATLGPCLQPMGIQRTLQMLCGMSLVSVLIFKNNVILNVYVLEIVKGRKGPGLGKVMRSTVSVVGLCDSRLKRVGNK